MSQDSVHQLVALLRRLRIACDLAHRDAVYFATEAEAATQLRREFDLRVRSGFEAQWLGPADVRRITGISARGAIRTKGSAQFDPYRACAGVMRTAVAAGAQVFERSAVRRIEAERNGVRVRTRDDQVEAQRVVIATGYATPAFRPLARRFRMYRTYVLATKPMSASERHDLGLSDVMLWDTERPYHYARWTADHRLLLGGGDRLVRPGQRRLQQFETSSRELRAYFETRLPALAATDIDCAWEGHLR